MARNLSIYVNGGKEDLNLSEHVHCMGSIPYMEMERNMQVRMYLLCRAFERRQARSYWRQCQKVFRLSPLISLAEQLFLMKTPVGFMEETRKEEYIENLKKGNS